MLKLIGLFFSIVILSSAPAQATLRSKICAVALGAFLCTGCATSEAAPHSATPTTSTAPVEAPKPVTPAVAAEPTLEQKLMAFTRGKGNFAWLVEQANLQPLPTSLSEIFAANRGSIQRRTFQLERIIDTERVAKKDVSEFNADKAKAETLMNQLLQSYSEITAVCLDRAEKEKSVVALAHAQQMIAAANDTLFKEILVSVPGSEDQQTLQANAENYQQSNFAKKELIFLEAYSRVQRAVSEKLILITVGAKQSPDEDETVSRLWVRLLRDVRKKRLAMPVFEEETPTGPRILVLLLPSESTKLAEELTRLDETMFEIQTYR